MFVLGIIITVEAFGEVLQYLPVPVLASIIILAVFRLIEIREFIFLYKVDWVGLCVWA